VPLDNLDQSMKMALSWQGMERGRKCHSALDLQIFIIQQVFIAHPLSSYGRHSHGAGEWDITIPGPTELTAIEQVITIVLKD
jgi:hypothetical protein